MDPDPSSMLVYKLLQLNCLAVYWQSDDSLLGISPPDNWTVCVCVWGGGGGGGIVYDVGF